MSDSAENQTPENIVETPAAQEPKAPVEAPKQRQLNSSGANQGGIGGMVKNPLDADGNERKPLGVPVNKDGTDVNPAPAEKQTPAPVVEGTPIESPPVAPTDTPPEVQAYNFSETFGEQYPDADSVKTALESQKTYKTETDQKILAMQATSTEKRSEFASKEVEMVNSLYADYGNQAFSVAQRLLVADQKDPVDAIVQHKIITSPSYATSESELRANLKEEYEAAKDDPLLMSRFNEKADIAIQGINALKEKYTPVQQEPVDTTELTNKLISEANAAKPELVEALTKIQLDETTFYEVSDAGLYADHAIEMLIAGGSITLETIADARSSMETIALGRAVRDGAFLAKIRSDAKAEAELKYIKERDNASTVEPGTKVEQNKQTEFLTQHKADVKRAIGGGGQFR